MIDPLGLALSRIPEPRPGARTPVDPRVVSAAAGVVDRVIVGHPILSQIRARAVAAIQGRDPGYRPLATASDVLAERLWTVCSLVSRAYRIPGNAEMLIAAKGLYSALPVLWLRDMTRQASALPVPAHTLAPDVLMASPLWFTFEVEYDGSELGCDSIYGILLEHTERIGVDGRAAPGIGMTWIGNKDEDAWILTGGQPYGPVDAYSGGASLSLLGMLSFLNSPYIPKTEARLPRQGRREAARKGYPVPDDRVLFVDLRAAVSDRQHDGDGAPGPDWQHRWVVRGHHRAQWYPSRRAHKVIWIAPHVKGPEGAPFKESVYRVVR